MSERPEGKTADAGGAPDADEPISELDALREAGDIDGLLALARAHRTGDGATKDLKACLQTYEVAAELGNAEANNAVALFYMAGGVVAQDMKKGVSHLRAAADGGHVAARVYLANLYELGVHYGKDASKADVWYRSAARGANVTADADSPEFNRAMAELGCVRHLTKLREAGGLEDADDQALTRKAMQLGLKLATRAGSDPGTGGGERVSVFGDGSAGAAKSRAPQPSTATATSTATSTATATSTSTATSNSTSNSTSTDDLKGKAKALESTLPKPKKAGRLTLKEGVGGFLYTLLFFAFAAGAGYALTQGAKVLLETRAALPLIGTRTHFILPAALALFGALPTILVYRGATFFRALLGAVVAFGIGWALWGTGSGAFVHDRMQQSIAGAVAGFLASLFVLGILGGTKKTDPNARI
jgi:TPR repeat protein